MTIAGMDRAVSALRLAHNLPSTVGRLTYPRTGIILSMARKQSVPGFARAVYVLHAFNKKSTTGKKTAAQDVEKVSKRLAALEAHLAKTTKDKKGK